MKGGAWAYLVTWWQTPGVPEFVSAIAGATFGALAAGMISLLLQRAAFKKEREDRQREKRNTDRSLLLQAFYSCLQASSDLHKFAQEATQARQRAPQLGSPKLPGLSNLWQALNALATLPEPISVDARSITVFIDHRDAELAMSVLDAVAVHRSTIKLWTRYGESRYRFGEKVPVRFDGETTYTTFTDDELARLYPHLKELTDLAEGICSTAAEYAAEAEALVRRLRDFIAKTTGEELRLTFPDETKKKQVQRQARTK